MATRPNIAPGFTDIVPIREDPIFWWGSALEEGSSKPAILQVLAANLPPSEVSTVRATFERLRSFEREGIYSPIGITNVASTPLLASYPYRDLKTLTEAPPRTEDALKILRDVCEALHALHNQNQYHGFISPASVAVGDGKTWLTNFGFASLLDLGNQTAFTYCGEFVAPEVKKGDEGSPISDIYGFAKLTGHLLPQVIGSTWYASASDSNPAKRLSPIRRAFDELYAQVEPTTAVVEDEAPPPVSFSSVATPTPEPESVPPPPQQATSTDTTATVNEPDPAFGLPVQSDEEVNTTGSLWEAIGDPEPVPYRETVSTPEDKRPGRTRQDTPPAPEVIHKPPIPPTIVAVFLTVAVIAIVSLVVVVARLIVH